jgi:hypothetical protein
VLLSCFADNLKVGIREEPRITEQVRQASPRTHPTPPWGPLPNEPTHTPASAAAQQFGNLQNFENMRDFKRERSFFGRFYYRFPQGESGLDVYTRVRG